MFAVTNTANVCLWIKYTSVNDMYMKDIFRECSGIADRHVWTWSTLNLLLHILTSLVKLHTPGLQYFSQQEQFKALSRQHCFWRFLIWICALRWEKFDVLWYWDASVSFLSLYTHLHLCCCYLCDVNIFNKSVLGTIVIILVRVPKVWHH